MAPVITGMTKHFTFHINLFSDFFFSTFIPMVVIIIIIIIVVPLLSCLRYCVVFSSSASGKCCYGALK
jgi:hypothetical protein